MISRALAKQKLGMTQKNMSLMTKAMRSFSHGPYNPLAYKTMLVAEDMPT
jgi:hypothetical protein